MKNKKKMESKDKKIETGTKKFDLEQFLKDSVKVGEILERREKEEKEREHAEV